MRDGIAISQTLGKKFMRPPVEFVEALQKTAAEHFAGSATGGGFDFVQRVYDDWIRSDSGSDMTAWLIGNLGSYFRWAERAPRWIEGEPAWPFHRGDPMVFIGQQTVDGEPRDDLPDDCTFYLFSGWDDDPEGRRMVTRVITQSGAIAEAVSSLNERN